MTQTAWDRLKEEEGAEPRFRLGDIVVCKITGFKGVAIARTIWMNNCPTWTVQPQTTKDGKPLDAKGFDEMGLDFVEKTDIVALPPTRPDVRIELGDTAKDRITGHEGVAIGWTTWLNGCSRIWLKPRELKDGMPVDATQLDEIDLVLVARAGEKPKPAKTGGPRPDPVR